MKKNTYRIILIIILTTLLILSAKFYHFEVKWYYYLILLFIGNIVGSFVFVYFSGVNINNLEYLDNSNDYQEFLIEYQLGLSDIKTIKGIFKNDLKLKESDLKNLLYQQTKRKSIKELEYVNEKQIIYSFKNQNLPILFKN